MERRPFVGACRPFAPKHGDYRPALGLNPLLLASAHDRQRERSDASTSVLLWATARGEQPISCAASSYTSLSYTSHPVATHTQLIQRQLYIQSEPFGPVADET